MNYMGIFEGLGVALPTPFAQDGSVDLEAYERVARHVVEGGADYLVALGSTGEAATVTDEERDAVVACARRASRGKPVVVGTGHNDTVRAMALARGAADSGADAILVVTPYYNKPQTAGLMRHYAAIAEAAGSLPIIAYNVPGRTGLNLTPRDVERLWELPQVIGLKESSGNMAQLGEIARTLPEGKLLISGDDALALPAIALGACGLISVAANALPSELKALVNAARSGRRDEAMRLHAFLLPFMDALFVETNPVPLKAALAYMGLCSDAPRLPLVSASPATKDRIELALRAMGRDCAKGAAA